MTIIQAVNTLNALSVQFRQLKISIKREKLVKGKKKTRNTNRH